MLIKLKKKINTTVCAALVISVVAALLFEFMAVYRYDKFKAVSDMAYSNCSLLLADFTYYDCNNSGNSINTVSQDPYIVYNLLNQYVGCLEIKLKEPMGVQWYCQVFYSNESGGFSEENSKGVWVAGDEKTVWLEINENIRDLRIDLGNEAGWSYAIKKISVNPTVAQYFGYLVSAMSYVRVFVYFMLLSAVALCALFRERAFDFIYRYRWAIAGCAIALCTLLKLNGSSIGYLYQLGLSGTDTSSLWGEARSIRSDEFVVFTEMALSQVKTGFSRVSDVWGYSGTDFAVTYGQQMWNAITAFRPFLAGYLILGGYGIAFYWSSRLICCLLVSFEFGRIFTKDNRKLSVLYAFLIALAPIVQWWYSINGIVELFVFGQAALVLIYYYFQTDKLWKKALETFGIMFCAGGYIMTFYPAWMVPLAWVFLAALIAILVENRKTIKIRKTDVILWLAGAALLAGMLIYFYLTSKDTISTIMNTVYPGRRKVNGGDIQYFPSCSEAGRVGSLRLRRASTNVRNRDFWIFSLWA